METIKAIAKRQSCRSYTGEQLSDEELQSILEAANAAPVGMGRYDEVKLTVIQNPEILAKLDAAGAELFQRPDSHPLYGAPTVILVSTKIPESQQNPSAYCNAACIVENMTIAATDLGIGSVYILGAVMALSMKKELWSEFKIADGFMPASAIALGKTTLPLNERELTLNKISTDYLK